MHIKERGLRIVCDSKASLLFDGADSGADSASLFGIEEPRVLSAVGLLEAVPVP